MSNSEDLKTVEDALQRKLPSKRYWHDKITTIQDGHITGKSFYRWDMNRFQSSNNTFIDCDFGKAACNSARFTNTKFINCIFSGASFQNAQFVDCSFEGDTPCKAANFSYSQFINCQITGLYMTTSALRQCYIEKSLIATGKIRSCTFYGTRVVRSTISNTDLSSVNLEYISVDDFSVLDNVVLPAYQVPYIINGLRFAVKHADSFEVRTDSKKKSGSYFLRQLPLLLTYFSGIKEYFPVANIYLANNQKIEAISAIKEGVEISLDQLDFHMVNNYCHLLCTSPEISNSDKRMIYNRIVSHINLKTLTGSDFYSYTQNIGMIRNLLINTTFQGSQVEIVIQTKINNDEVEQVMELYKSLERTLKSNNSDEHIDFIEIRHNSPYEFLITSIDSIPELIKLIGSVYLLVRGVAPKVMDIVERIEKFYKEIMEEKREQQRFNHEKQMFALEEKKMRLDIDDKEQDIIKKRLENDKLQNEIKTSDQHNEVPNAIPSISQRTATSITSIRHIIHCNSAMQAEDIPVLILADKYQL